MEKKDKFSEQTTTTRCRECWDRGRYWGWGKQEGGRGSQGRAMDALGEMRGLERERIMPKIPRKRIPECKSSAGLPQLRNGPVGVGGEIHSIMTETHEHYRAMEAFSRQRLFLELERTLSTGRQAQLSAGLQQQQEGISARYCSTEQKEPFSL